MTRGFIDGEYQDGELRGINFLVGRRGYGKTTEMNRLHSQCTGGILFFDALSKHGGMFAGYVMFSEPGRLEEYLRVNRGRRFHIMYQPRGGNLDEHFAAVCKIVVAFGWMIFGVDELDKLCGMRFGESRMPQAFYDIVNYGRHHRVSVIATARRPQGVPTGFRDESELRVFGLKPGKALEAIRTEIGDEAASQVAQLPKYQYLHFVEDEEPVLCQYPL